MKIAELIFVVAICPVLFQGSGPVCILLHKIKRTLSTLSSTKYANLFLSVCAENALVTTMQTSPGFYILFSLLRHSPAFTTCENSKYIRYASY